MTPTPSCYYCDCNEDTVQHTLEVYVARTEQRREHVEIIGADLTLPSIAKTMRKSVKNWDAVAAFCEAVVSPEAAERVREEFLYHDMLCRRREYLCLMPPYPMSRVNEPEISPPSAERSIT